MIVGVPKEIRDKESRIALTPEGAKQLASVGHEVLVERSGGLGSGFGDEEYAQSGASVVSAEEAWGAEMVMKVKEPMESEYRFLKEDQILLLTCTWQARGLYRDFQANFAFQPSL